MNLLIFVKGTQKMLKHAEIPMAPVFTIKLFKAICLLSSLKNIILPCHNLFKLTTFVPCKKPFSFSISVPNTPSLSPAGLGS